jgi:tetratricopeptide (TPR) repeat protein
LLLPRIARKRIAFIPIALACAATAFGQQEDALSAARVLLQQGKNQEAIAQLKQLAARRPGLKGISRELGVAYYREGEYLQAAQYLQDAWKENPEDRDAAQLLGLSFYFSGRPAEAIPALDKVRSWHPNANIDAFYILGLCYVMTNRYPEARRTFAQLYGVTADSAAAHLLLGRMLLRQGFDPAAELEIETALSLSPQLPLAHLALGELDVYAGNYPRGVQEFEAELLLNPACAPALTHLGEVFWRMNRDADSQRVLRRSITLDATASEPYVVLGKVLLRQGQQQLAEENLRRAVKLDPGSYTAHYFLGLLYRSQGNMPAAERELGAATRIQQLNASNPGRN